MNTFLLLHALLWSLEEGGWVVLWSCVAGEEVFLLMGIREDFFI